MADQIYSTRGVAKRGAERALARGDKPEGSTYTIDTVEGGFIVAWSVSTLDAENAAYADACCKLADTAAKAPAIAAKAPEDKTTAKVEDVVTDAAPHFTSDVVADWLRGQGWTFEPTMSTDRVDMWARDGLDLVVNGTGAVSLTDGETTTERTPEECKTTLGRVQDILAFFTVGAPVVDLGKTNDTATYPAPVVAPVVAPVTAPEGAKPKPAKGGVLDMIEAALLAGNASVEGMTAAIVAATGKDAIGVTATVKTQLSRMKQTRGLTITRASVDGKSVYSATKG